MIAGIGRSPFNRHFYEIRIPYSASEAPISSSFRRDRRADSPAGRVFSGAANVQRNAAKSDGPATKPV
jgi:hypothetical protein